MSGTSNPTLLLPRHGPTRVVFLSACLLLAGLLPLSAASFQNLNFESSPSFPPGDYAYPFDVYANALPGWAVHVDNTIQNGAFANEFILDAPGVALMTGSANPLDGQKSVYLQSAYSGGTNQPGARP